MHDYEKIVKFLEEAVAGDVTLAQALENIEIQVTRPKRGARWDYIPTGIFGSLSKIAAENAAKED